MTFWRAFLNFNRGKKKNIQELSREYLDTIKIMTWNVLARKATRYQSNEHMYHPDAIKHLSEHIEQTIRRYELIFEQIEKNDMDIIFLQEVDVNLYTYMKKHLKNDYQIIFNPVLDNNSNNQSLSFGTAILFKNKRFLLNKTYEINSKSDKYAWKNATVALLNDKKNKKGSFYCISIHLSGSQTEKNIELLKDTFKKIKKEIPILIAGDFNCRYLLSDCLLKYDQFKELNTFKIKKKDISTCTFDYDNKHKKSLIDGIFFSKKFEPITYQIGKHKCQKKLYQKNENYSDINYGSDHFWIKGLIQLKI